MSLAEAVYVATRRLPTEERFGLSIRELETHVMLAERLRVIPDDIASGLMAQLAEVGRLITGLAKSLKR
ncbi:MAG: hypothetical protein HYY76_20325 [Acidobacteria bacterium]|nr:hypothetical protein [Acidobacteriota bacterium]